MVPLVRAVSFLRISLGTIDRLPKSKYLALGLADGSVKIALPALRNLARQGYELNFLAQGGLASNPLMERSDSRLLTAFTPPSFGPSQVITYKLTPNVCSLQQVQHERPDGPHESIWRIALPYRLFSGSLEDSSGELFRLHPPAHQPSGQQLQKASEAEETNRTLPASSSQHPLPEGLGPLHRDPPGEIFLETAVQRVHLVRDRVQLRHGDGLRHAGPAADGPSR